MDIYSLLIAGCGVETDIEPWIDFFEERWIDLYWMWRYITGHPPFYHHSYGGEM